MASLLAAMCAVAAGLAPLRAREARKLSGHLRLLGPALQDGVARQPVCFEWNQVSGSDAYRLHVGTAPGKHDLVHSGRMQEARRCVGDLPAAAVPLFARVFARRRGVWISADLRFVASPLAAEWLNPRPGAADVSPTDTMEWTSVPEADEYWLGWVPVRVCRISSVDPRADRRGRVFRAFPHV